MRHHRLPIVLLAVALVLAVSWRWIGGAGGAATPAPETSAGQDAGAVSIRKPTAAPVIARSAAAREEVPRSVSADAAPAEAVTEGAEHPFRAQLIDAETEEPLPYFDLGLWKDYEELEELTTDADGRFVTKPFARPLEFGMVLDDDAEDSGSYDDIDVELTADDDGSVERTYRIDVGPTYSVQLIGTRGRSWSEFRARIGSSTERGRIRGELGRAGRRLREGPLPWVRFDRWDVSGTGATFWFLDVVSNDGLLLGSARVDSIVGVYPSAVEVRLEPSGAVEGTVLAGGKPPAPRTWINLFRVGSTESAGSGADENGAFSFGALAPGSWEAAVNVERFEPVRQPVAVVAGEVTRVEIELERAATAGAVEGRLVSASGTWDGDATIALWSFDAGNVNRRKPVEWQEEDGELVFEFRFEDVRPGEHELHFVSRGCPYEILPAPVLHVGVPSSGHELTIADDVPQSELSFDVLDTVTGTVPAEVGVWWWTPNGWADFSHARATESVRVEAWPDDRAIFWAMRIPGRGLVYGDENDFVRAGPGKRVATVRFEGGWGAQLFVEESGQRGGVEGVVLAFDGVEASPSSTRGLVRAVLPSRPKSIAVVTPGWRIVGGNVDPADGSFDDETWWAMGVQVERVAPDIPD